MRVALGTTEEAMTRSIFQSGSVSLSTELDNDWVGIRRIESNRFEVERANFKKELLASMRSQCSR